MTVFANMLEISAKAQGCKVIAAFPDVCFTPPLTPATPPGVPIPYPNFGMDSDLTSGSCTVKIGGQPVSQENSSKYSKCSGDEAGAAPKKGIISSTNMGMMYGLMWSLNVKVDAKGVLRFGDMATSNHSANPGDTPPMALVGKPNPAMADCPAILLKLGMTVHPYSQAGKHCTSGQQSDHILQNACFQNSRGGEAISTVKDYKMGTAPCVCLEDATDPNTEHGRKTKSQGAWAKAQRAKGKNPTYKEVVDANMAAMKEAKKPQMNDNADGSEHDGIKCLRMICDAHFKPMMTGEEEKKDATQVRTPASGKFKPVPTATTGAI